MDNIIVYENGEIELKVSVDNNTIWLTQKQLAEVFNVNIPAISKHIKNIFNIEELIEESVISILETTAIDGKRYRTKHYNLDMILSVGYRINSTKATRFRQWATSVLKSYITNGYALNNEKITQQRLLNIENDIENIKGHINNNTLEVKQGIFYNGQVFEAYSFISNIIKSAKNNITIIDNYCDDTVLTLLSKNTKVKINIITSNISKEFKLDIKKYNSQYNNLKVTTSQKYHDRFIIIDDSDTYHIGASLKDLGKRVFAFSKINRNSLVLTLKENI